MHRMDLHTVDSGRLAELCRLRKGINDLMDLLFGHLRTFDVVCPAGALRRRRSQFMRCIEHRLEQCTSKSILMQRCDQVGDRPRSAHAGRELDEQLCAGLVQLIHELLKLIEHLFILPQPLSPEGIAHRCNARNDQADIVLRSFQKQPGRFLIKMAPRQLKPTKQ